MGFIKVVKVFYKKLSESNALDQCSTQEEKDFYEPVYRLLYISGFSLHDTSFGYRAYSMFGKVMVGMFVTSELWFLVDCRTLNDLVASVSVSIINVLAIYRYWHMIQNIELFKKISKTMNSQNFDISTRQRRDIVKSWIKRNNLYFKLVIIVASSTVIVWNFKPLLDNTEYNLVVQLHIPFKFDTPSRYPLVYMFTSLTFNYSAYFVIANDLVMQTLLIHLICQFNVLADCFENVVKECAIKKGRKMIFNCNFHDKFEKRFCNLIDQHSSLLSCTEELRNTLKYPMLGQLVSSAFLICFAAYQVTAALKSDIVTFITSVLYLIYNLIELLIFCRWCDEIRIQSLNIREAVYCCGWELALLRSPGARGMLQFVIARATKPLVLNAGGIWDISLASYAFLIRTSYSALTVLLQMGRASN